jgi:circadian clock protein KaiC
VASLPTRCVTGVSGLDDLLHGGLICNRLYLVDGHPGAGKTTLALQFLLEGVRRGERCLYVTLSESRSELAAGAASHGWSLDAIEMVELLHDEAELDSDNHLTMYHPSEVEMTDTTTKVLDAVRRVDPARVVFDSLSELRLLAQNSLRYRRQILALKQFFSGRNCTVLMLDDRTAEGPDMQLHSIAHGVISLDHRSPAYGRTLRQLQVVKLRGSDYRSGLHDFAIEAGGLVVYPRLTTTEDASRFEPGALSSGVARLDALLGGGIDGGTSTLVIGPPGTGKSTVALQYAVAATRRGQHAAMFTFDESREALLARLNGLGMPIREGSGPGEILIRRVNPAEVAPGQFAHLVSQSVDRDGARVVIIDSLNGYMNAMPEGRFLTTQLHELLAYLGSRGVATFIVVAQSGMMGQNMVAPVDTTYLADTVVLMRFFEHDGMVKKAISVLKRRTGQHEQSIRQIWFAHDGIHLSEPLDGLRGVLTGVPEERDVDRAGDSVR